MNKLFIFVLAFFTSLANASIIEFIVRAAPGGPDDVMTRKFAEIIEKETSLKIVVNNKPGAAHQIGYNYFETRTTPALIIADNNVINSSEEIFFIGEFTNILFVKSGTVKTLDEFISLANKKDIFFGHGGVGTYSHAAADALCKKIRGCVLVPYKSGAPAMVDLAAGLIDAYALISYGTNSFINNDRFTPIVLYSNSKHPGFSIPLLPKKYKDIEIKNSIAVYGKNISQDNKLEIAKALGKLESSFFTDNGLWVKK